jgi:hypothetical protein
MQWEQTDSAGPTLEFASSNIFNGSASDDNGASVPLRARPHTGQISADSSGLLVVGSGALIVLDMFELCEFTV